MESRALFQKKKKKPGNFFNFPLRQLYTCFTSLKGPIEKFSRGIYVLTRNIQSVRCSKSSPLSRIATLASLEANA